MSGKDIGNVKALVFDVFGTVVDWRSSVICELETFGRTKRITADWVAIADGWRAGYMPSMDRVRKGETPWKTIDELHRTTLESLLEQHRVKGLSEAEKDHLNRSWHRLKPWPDAVAGLTRLKRRYIIGTLSNGNVALLLNMAKNAGLPWDMIFSAELVRHYKPDPETYRSVPALLRVAPGEVMLVAAHNNDLVAAARQGLHTGFVARPSEYGPHQKHDFKAEHDFDVVAEDFLELAERMGV
ncbi:MAG TPA: haloacid dehalogenase type II [Stellaceae bacterium]|nr:haloacid dehalogenase type II [Stellaceae bacterium]